MTTNKPEVVAYATHHDEPMLFPNGKEAAAYCEDGEEPVALIRLSDYEALQAKNERLKEALRGMVDNACAACDVLPNGTHRIDATEQEWASHVAATDKAIATLHPTAAQEEGK